MAWSDTQLCRKDHIRNFAGMLKSTSATGALLKERKLDREREDKNLPGVVLDSFAVLAFLFGEPGYDKILTVLEKAADTIPILCLRHRIGRSALHRRTKSWSFRMTSGASPATGFAPEYSSCRPRVVGTGW